jgi:hypothetical protein
MTQQEIFDKVARHLLTQKKRATVSGHCRYRTPDGCKCAIGCLISDEDYDPEFEGERVTHLLGRHAIPSLENLDCDRIFLSRLQVLHDTGLPINWPKALHDFAISFCLSPTILSEFLP